MAKGYYDPWKKKSKAGMKSLNKIVTTGFKVGKAMTKSNSKNKRKKYPASNYNNPAKGCLVSLLFLTAMAAATILFIFKIN